MMHDADVIVWATLIYFYSVSGQMKTMIDRANALYDSDYKFTETYLLGAAAEDEPHVVAGAKTALQGWVDCFECLSLKGVVFAGSVTMPADIKGNPLDHARIFAFKNPLSRQKMVTLQMIQSI